MHLIIGCSAEVLSELWNFVPCSTNELKVSEFQYQVDFIRENQRAYKDIPQQHYNKVRFLEGEA